MRRTPTTTWLLWLACAPCHAETAPVLASAWQGDPPPTLAAPVRIEADGRPIDIGRLAPIAHAGPCLGDFTGDGVRDLLVGDFPGYFWLFENTGTDAAPRFTSRGKLQAGGTDAKTPVY